MNGRTIAVRTAAVTTAGLGALLILGGPATAAPEPTPLQQGMANLDRIAGEDTAAKAGVGALHSFTSIVGTDRLRDISTAFTPFGYAAPTFGCGSNGPITTIIAAGTSEVPGPRSDQGIAPGSLRFSATPAHSGMPLASGLSVAWVNVATGASGVDVLDDHTEYGLPSLSKTVRSGAGTVLASMWGTIDYPGARCVMTPTVGTFTVTDLPAAAPETSAAPAPAPETTPPGSAGTGGAGAGAAPSTPAPAPADAPAPAPAAAPTTTPAPPAAVTVGG
ncbi:hypothetical protein ACFYTF_08940 [Nocardia thailandica]|uniref:Uncharacterized protein n=1 Tax=Nocardia thailandica TaxID=257275 RepID=A0ABW6PKP0_9NOCA